MELLPLSVSTAASIASSISQGTRHVPSRAAHRSEKSKEAAKGLSRPLFESEREKRRACFLRLRVARSLRFHRLSFSLFLTSTPSLDAGFCSGASAAGTLIVVVSCPSSSLEEPFSSTTSSAAPPSSTQATVALTHSSASALASFFAAAAACGRTHTSVPLVCSEAVAAAGAAPAMVAHKVEKDNGRERKKKNDVAR